MFSDDYPAGGEFQVPNNAQGDPAFRHAIRIRIQSACLDYITSGTLSKLEDVVCEDR